ncbi:MAG TPA: DUF3014 domain-containing protein [Vicinamibacteria bacterium]|jgi:hypothetical protein
MSEWDEVEIEKPPDRFGSGGPGLLPIGILVVLLLLIGAGFYFFYWQRGEPEPEPAPVVEVPEPTETEIEETAPPVELPPLGESDAFLRELVAKLSSNPRLTAWLVNDNLIRRFTMIVDNIADGVSPRAHLLFLEPEEEFRVIERAESLYIDPASYSRYDAVGEVFASLDAEGSAELYRMVKPLIDEAYAEVGRPDRSFDQTLALAMRDLLETPVPEDSVEVVPRIKTYALANPRLESLTDAQKHFFRMGPDNVLRIQVKLRELAPKLGVR